MQTDLCVKKIVCYYFVESSAEVENPGVILKKVR